MNRLFALLLLSTLSLHAQEPLTVLVHEEETAYSSYADSLVTVVLDVTDSRGDGLLELNEGNLTVESAQGSSNLVQEVISFEDSELGVAVILCLDVSGSMAGTPLTNMKAAVNRYLDMLRPQDRASVVVVHDEVQKMADFSNDIAHLRRTVDNLTAMGNSTILYDAVYQSIGYFSQAAGIPARRVLIVISDGKDEGSVYTESNCVERANQERTPIHSIGFALPRNTQYLRNMEKLSEQTGGRYFHAASSGSIQEALLGAVLDLMNSRYLLTFRVPDSLYRAASQSYRVRVATRAFSGEKAFTINPPPGVIPAPQQPDSQEVLGGASTGLPYWFLPAAGAFLVAVLAVVLLSRRSISKKEDEFRKRQQELDESLREAQLKAQEAEKKAEEAKAPPQKPKVPEPPEDEPFIQRNVEDAGQEPDSSLKAESESSVLSQNRHARTDRTMVGDMVLHVYGTASLEVVEGLQSGTSFPLEGDEFTIGRASDNRIVLHENTVSGHHAVIRNANGIFQITDLDSTNGTSVNGVPKKSAVLENGDVLKLGSARLRFEAR